MLFSVGNGAMNAQRYWQRRSELLRDIGKGATAESCIERRENILVSRFVPQFTWERYSRVFDFIWTASAFKGRQAMQAAPNIF